MRLVVIVKYRHLMALIVAGAAVVRVSIAPTFQRLAKLELVCHVVILVRAIAQSESQRERSEFFPAFLCRQGPEDRERDDQTDDATKIRICMPVFLNRTRTSDDYILSQRLETW